MLEKSVPTSHNGMLAWLQISLGLHRYRVIWKQILLKTVNLLSLSLSFCFSEQKLSKNQVFGAPQSCADGNHSKTKKEMYFPFSILLLHTSQSPGKLLITPLHLHMRRRKLSCSAETKTPARSWSQEQGSDSLADSWLMIPIDLQNLVTMLTATLLHL